jgi:hypothetical protein
LRPGPQEDLNPCNWVLGSSGQRSWNSPAKFRQWWSPAARGNRPGRTRRLGATLVEVMCRSGLTGVGGTAMTRDGGGEARLWRRCCGMLEIGEGWGCGLGAASG